MIQVLLAHSSHFVCASLQYALNNEEGIDVKGGATTLEEFYFFLPDSNIILLGTEFKEDGIIDLIDEVRVSHPKTKVLVLGVEERVEEIIQYIEAGAAGYVLQNESIMDIKQKLVATHEEKAIVSPHLAAAVMSRLNQLANLEAPYATVGARKTQIDELTPREREVLQLVSAGHTNYEIANKLVLACGTVKNHVHKILKKLQVNNRREAALIFQMH